MAQTPSPWWADELRARRIKRFPPRADATPMRRCTSRDRHCAGRFYPFYYHSSDCVCEDCREILRLHLRRRFARFCEGETCDLPRGSPVVTLADQTPPIDQTLAEELPSDVPEFNAEYAALNGRPPRDLPSEKLADLLIEIQHYQATQELVIRFADGTTRPADEPPPPAA